MTTESNATFDIQISGETLVVPARYWHDLFNLVDALAHNASGDAVACMARIAELARVATEGC